MSAAEAVDGNEGVHKNLVEKLVEATQRRWKDYTKQTTRKRQAPDSHEHEDENGHEDLVEVGGLIETMQKQCKGHMEQAARK